MIEIAEFDHRCCWIDRWPELLSGTPSDARKLSAWGRHSDAGDVLSYTKPNAQ